MEKETAEEILKSQPYRKPEIKKQEGMLFSKQILEEFGAGCHQCTSCHGCR